MKTRTRAALAIIPLTLLALDLAKPGQWQFLKPAYSARALIDEARALSMAVVDFSDPRLEPCGMIYAGGSISEAQEQARAALVGESETVAIQQLGPPACALAGGGLRWLTAQGLALDVRATADGVIESAKLAR